MPECECATVGNMPNKNRPRAANYKRSAPRSRPPKHPLRSRSAVLEAQNTEGRLVIEADGTLRQIGSVPLSRCVAALSDQLRLFLKRLDTCERNDAGDYIFSDARVGALDGMRVLWENVGLLASMIVASSLPGLNEKDRAAFARTGLLYRAVVPARNTRPLTDAMQQLLFSIVRPPGKVWVESIPASSAAKIRAIAGELPDHRRMLERTEGGPPPSPSDLEQRELVDALRSGSAMSPTGKPSFVASLTPNEARVWRALHGYRLTAHQLAKTVDTSEQVVRECVAAIRAKRGTGTIVTGSGGGYFRPDAPPPDNAVVTRRRRRFSPSR